MESNGMESPNVALMIRASSAKKAQYRQVDTRDSAPKLTNTDT